MADQTAPARSLRPSASIVGMAALLALFSQTSAAAAPGKASAKARISPPVQDRMTLTCAWGKSTFMEVGRDGFKTEIDEGAGALTFSVIEGQLTVTGKAGGEKLTLLGNAPASGAMFFAEVTGIGNVVLWSFYRVSDSRVLFIKQNNYAPKLTPDEGVHIYGHAGYCDVTGGNGRPITR